MGRSAEKIWGKAQKFSGNYIGETIYFTFSRRGITQASEPDLIVRRQARGKKNLSSCADDPKQKQECINKQGINVSIYLPPYIVLLWLGYARVCIEGRLEYTYPKNPKEERGFASSSLLL